MNVVVIVVDALRADKVGVHSGGKLTPNIDSLGQKGQVFNNCFSCANATDSSVTTILTGLYPTRHGVLNQGAEVTKTEKKFVSNTVPLPERISDTHDTVAVDTLERWHSRGFNNYLNPRHDHKSQIIDILSDLADILPPKMNRLAQRLYKSTAGESGVPPGQVPGNRVTDLAIDYLEQRDSPFFMFLHYWDAHIPYMPSDRLPEGLRNERDDEEDKTLEELLRPINGSPWAERLQGRLSGVSSTVSELKSKYDSGIWNADREIGRLFEFMRSNDIFNNTMVIVTSDHGESLTEHGIFFDHHGLYDQTIHVPLIIYSPEFQGQENKFVQHFDLAPTILDYLNQDYNPEWFDGRSLLPDTNSEGSKRKAVFVEEGHTARRRAVRTESHKYIKRIGDSARCDYCQIRHGLDEELYDLNRDTLEINNIIQDVPKIREQLVTMMEQWVDSVPAPSKGKVSFETSEKVEQHLRDMGYM